MSLLVLAEKLAATPVRSVLLFYLPTAFALMVTVFSPRQFLKKHDDLKSYIFYFGLFWLFFCLIPALVLIVQDVELASIGLTFGDGITGTRVLLIGIPLGLLAAYVGSLDPEMKSQYPFSKQACRSGRTFLLYELAYLVFYYFSWEFLFRGLLLFYLLAQGDIIAAVAIQAMVSTIYHIGHPRSEIFGALIGGFIFGFIAVMTGSFLYSLIIHAIIGMSIDSRLYFRYHREATEIS